MVVVHKSALKHGLSEDEVKTAWNNVQEYRRTRSEKLPPHYMAVGFLNNGRSVELVLYSDGMDWHIFHAMSPVTPNFKRLYKQEGK